MSIPSIMKVAIVALILITPLPFQLSAQQILSGVVTNAETMLTIEGVNVFLPKSEKGTITNSQGLFTIEVPMSEREIYFSYVGYQTQKVKIAQTDNLQIALVPHINLEEVVIEAIRATDSAPIAKTDINRQQIETIHIGQDALFMLEKQSPSIITYSESGTGFSNYGQFRLRGMDQSRVNITLNGAPLNDMIDQGVFFSNFSDFSNSLESVQVQRGVGTSTNGTASYAGSVNFESVELAAEAPSAELEAVAGTFGTYRGSAALKTGLMENNMAFYSRFSTFRSDGYRYNTSTRSWSFYGSGGYFGEKDLIKFTGFIGRSKNGLGYTPIALSDIQKDPRTNYLNENDIDDFGQWMFQLQHSHIFNDQVSLASTLYYGGSGGDFPFGFFDEDENLVQINYPLSNDHYGFISTVNYNSIDSRLNIHGGLHGYIFKRNNRESILPDDANPYYDEHSRKDEISIFGKMDYNIGDFTFYGDMQLRILQLTINPDNTILENQPDIIKPWRFLNPRIGISYQLRRSMDFYLSYGRNGREPTKIDLLGGFQLTGSNLPGLINDDVKPEYVNDFEGGVHLRYPSFSAQANLFYMLFKNEIAPIGAYVPEGFIQLRKNVPDSYRRGIELDVTWDISNTLSLTGNSTYMNSQIREYAPDGDVKVYRKVTPALSPEWILNAGLHYQFLSRFTVSASGRYVGQSFQEPTNDAAFMMPAFFTADANISFTFGKSYSLALFLNNIFDRQYYTYGAPVDLDYDGTFDEPGYFIQPPRNIYARLRVIF